MKKFILFVIAIFLLAIPASAHRLKEYLEATTITLSKGKVSLELRLTSGVAVAKYILNTIDIGHDKQISPIEQQAYFK